MGVWGLVHMEEGVGWDRREVVCACACENVCAKFDVTEGTDTEFPAVLYACMFAHAASQQRYHVESWTLLSRINTQICSHHCIRHALIHNQFH